MSFNLCNNGVNSNSKNYSKNLFKECLNFIDKKWDEWNKELDISNKDSENIKNISKKIEEKNIINDIRPDSFESGCILYYCIINNINCNKTDISKFSKISEVTINKCYKKILSIYN